MEFSTGFLNKLLDSAVKYYNTDNNVDPIPNKLSDTKIAIEKFKLKKVDFIDNSFFMDLKKAKKYMFDENYFLYSETIDFCLKLKNNNEKNYVSEKIRFKHYGSDSVDKEYSFVSILTRAWHYNWSKFYYYKKNYNYFFALRKIFPNFITNTKGFGN